MISDLRARVRRGVIGCWVLDVCGEVASGSAPKSTLDIRPWAPKARRFMKHPLSRSNASPNSLQEASFSCEIASAELTLRTRALGGATSRSPCDASAAPRQKSPCHHALGRKPAASHLKALPSKSQQRRLLSRVNPERFRKKSSFINSRQRPKPPHRIHCLIGLPGPRPAVPILQDIPGALSISSEIRAIRGSTRTHAPAPSIQVKSSGSFGAPKKRKLFSKFSCARHGTAPSSTSFLNREPQSLAAFRLDHRRRPPPA